MNRNLSNLDSIHFRAACISASLRNAESLVLLGAKRATTRDALGASTALRNRWIQSIIDEAGANAQLELWDGARPATGGTPAGAKKATLVGGTVIGVALNGALDFSETNFTQTQANHVTGVPTWFRIKKSDGTHVVDGSFGGVDGTFSGSVTTGTPVTFNPSTITAPNA